MHLTSNSRIYIPHFIEKVEYGIVVSPSAELNGEYDFLPRKFIHSEWSSELAEKIIKQQNQSGGAPAFLVLDDGMGTVDFNSKAVHLQTPQSQNYYLHSVP